MRHTVLGALFLIAIGLAACAGTRASIAPEGRIVVATSIAPLADFAAQVGGDRVEVVTLVPPGASPHTYEFTASQVKQVTNARVLVLNGVGLEYWADKLVESAANPELVVVDSSIGVQILAGEDEHIGGNPHIWLDPVCAMIQVGNIRDALAQADPDHADQYRANAKRYVEELVTLDREITAEVAGWSHRQFITFHPAWVYFARHYGLVQAAVIEETPGREPSPAEIAEIVETARRIEAKAIFAEPQLSPKTAQIIAEESGATVLFLDPLGSNLDDASYLGLMRHNVAQMASALR